MDAKELKNQIRAKAAQKNDSELATWLFKVGQEKGAKTQLKMADMLIDDRGGYASLADTILVQQSHKIERFSEKAFPLSEKQCDVIARAFVR